MVPLYRLPHYRLPRCIGAREIAALALLAFPMAMADPMAAQQPSPGQIATLRQACRSDFIAHCSGVQPGGREALECLERNAARLSTQCGSAVSAVLPKAETRPGPSPETSPQTPAAETNPQTPPLDAPQPAAGQPSPQDQLTAVQEACTLKDFMSHCSWIAPGNPELLLCLRANAAGLSPACQNVVRATPAAAAPSAVAAPPVTAQPITAPPMPAPPAAAAPQPAPAAPRAATAPQRPSAKQLGAIRAACRSDFIAHCSGVQPGGREALMCLERNQGEISQSCQGALAAIGGGTPSLGAATPGAASADPASPDAATPPAETEPFLIPRLPLRAEIAILRVCAASHRSLCGDVPPGGGRIIACLARNAPRLLPECRAALAAVRG
jgi:Cysteine rich repeat